MGAAVHPLAGHEEEKLDTYVFRPLSHPVAVVAAKLRMSPNAVSVAGMLFGIAAGWFFQYRDASLVIWGVAFYVVRNILDYADGQLARMTRSGTRYGYYFDGLCDYLATVSVYVFAVIGIWPEYGWWGLALAAAAGTAGSLQSSLLDFYKHEYKFWALGEDRARCPLADKLRDDGADATGFDRFLLRNAISYARMQLRLTKGRRTHDAAWLPHRDGGDSAAPPTPFQALYFRLQRWPLKGWFLVGPNWHTYLFFACGLAGRMDVFFWIQLVGQGALALGIAAFQRSMDRRLDAALTAGEPTA